MTVWVARLRETPDGPPTDPQLRAAGRVLPHAGFSRSAGNSHRLRWAGATIPGLGEPLHARSGSVEAVGSAVLTNRVDLRTTLRQGLIGDLELAAAAFERWGVAAAAKLRGQYAFVVANERTGDGWALTDAYGSEALFSRAIGDSVLFSNSIACLVAACDSADPDPRWIADFLTVGVASSETTIWRQIDRRPAGSVTRLRDGAIVLRTAEGSPTVPDVSHPQAAFHRVLKRAVDARCRGLSPALQLSAGLDSSIIAACARHLNPIALTIALGADRDDDTARLASVLGEHLAIEHELLDAEHAVSLRAPETGEVAIAEPVGLVHLEPHYRLLSRAARTRSIVLTGFGADALYKPDIHSPADYIRRDGLLASLRGVASSLRHHGRLPPLGWRPDRPPSPARGLREHPWVPSAIAELSPSWRRAKQGVLDAGPTGTRSELRHGGIWRRVFAGFAPATTHLPIAPRFPYFDVELEALVRALPIMPWMQDKHIARAAFHRELPGEIAGRRKTVLPEPIGRAMVSRPEGGRLLEYVLALARTPGIEDWVHVDAVAQILATPANQPPWLYSMALRSAELGYWLRGVEKIREIAASPCNDV